jgi:hypothetical protein
MATSQSTNALPQCDRLVDRGPRKGRRCLYRARFYHHAGFNECGLHKSDGARRGHGPSWSSDEYRAMVDSEPSSPPRAHPEFLHEVA